MISEVLHSGMTSKEPGFYKMIFLSVIAHFVVITIVFVSVPTRSRHLTFGPVYSVSLVGSEVALAKNQESSLMKEIERSNEAASSIALKKDIGRSAATPIKKEEINRSTIEKAISAIKLKEKTSPDKSGAAKTTGRVASAGNARVNDSEVAAQRQEYIGFVWSRIQKNWTLPPTLMPKENIETIIVVRIARSGGVEFMNFEKRSGNGYFDDAALKTVKKSSPFPPFPSRMTDNNIEIGIRFHPSQFR